MYNENNHGNSKPQIGRTGVRYGSNNLFKFNLNIFTETLQTFVLLIPG